MSDDKPQKDKQVSLDEHKASLVRQWVSSGRSAKTAPIYLLEDSKHVEQVCWKNRKQRRAELAAKRRRK